MQSRWNQSLLQSGSWQCHVTVFSCPGGMKSRAHSADEFSPVEVWVPPTSGPGFTDSALLWEQPSCQFIEQKRPGLFCGVYYQIRSTLDKSYQPPLLSPSTHFLGKTSVIQGYMHWICTMGSLPERKKKPTSQDLAFTWEIASFVGLGKEEGLW